MNNIINRIVLIIIIIISISLFSNPSTAITDNQNNHYIVVGHIYPPYNSTTVYLENSRTSEILSVNIIDCEHNLKEYLFDLANLKQGWNNKDIIQISYGNKSQLSTKEVTINTEFAGIQLDFNAPYDYTPIAIVSGCVLVFYGGYYYIMKKKPK